MAKPMLLGLLTVSALLLVRAADAADLPPRPVPPPPSPPSYSPYAGPYARKSAYEVWQYYGVDRQGHFRSRVVLSPYGSYYLYNGAPFPWALMHQRDFMPYALD